MKALFLSILALLPAAASAQRDTLGVLERSSVFSAEDERAVAGFHTESPAMMLYRSEQSLSQISLRIDLRREQEALLQPLGDGAFDGGFYAESYRRLSERSATWADARYVRGNRRNVCWNSTADYLLLYPCITADSAGGNLSTEEYAFGGGYVHRVGRFDLAIRGDYRAGQEYRQVDPRPHNVVSDFTIKLGVGMQFPQYVLGLDLQGRLYKQDQDIDFFYPPGASSSELYMTGLGSYYTRYSLNSESFNIGYDGKGCLLAAQLMPRHAKGWYARAAFESLTTERLNKSNNTVPITRLKTRQATLSAAYRAVLRSGTRQRRMAPSAVARESDGRNRLLRLARRGGFAQQRAEQHFGIPDLHGGAAERPGRRPRGVPAGRTPPEPESGLLRRGGVDAPVLQRRIVRTRSDGDVRHPVLNDRTNICQTNNKNQL